MNVVAVLGRPGLGLTYRWGARHDVFITHWWFVL